MKKTLVSVIAASKIRLLPQSKGTYAMLLSLLSLVGAVPSAAQTVPTEDPLSTYADGIPPAVEKVLTEVDTVGVNLRTLIFRYAIESADNSVRENRIFAAIAKPTGAGPYPGLLILHGGGGAAEVEKALKWAQHGYVALTLDIPGIADAKKAIHSEGYWKSLPYGEQRFVDNPDITTSVLVDGIAAALKGLYLLRSDNKVNTQAIGITGISWGGYMTVMLSGLAPSAIHAAFSAYGSGFYDKGSTFIKPLAELASTHRERWLTYLDAGRRCCKITSPLFIAAAANDHWFYPPAVTATLRASAGEVNHLFAPNASHTLPLPGGTQDADRVGWVKMEEAYFEYHLKHIGKPLPRISESRCSLIGNPTKPVFKARFRIVSESTIKHATVWYSKPDTVWPKKQWIEAPATLVADDWYEAVLPDDIWQRHGYWYATATDARDLSVSSYLVEAWPTTLPKRTAR